MREYAIYYIGTEGNEQMNMVGSGYGATKEEAIEDFLFWHKSTCIRITSIELYK